MIGETIKRLEAGMLPKRGQQWSYLDRGRTLAVSSALPVLGGIAVGIYVLITKGDWILLVLGLVALALVGLLAWENERHNRVPVFDDEPEEIKEIEDVQL
jgi:hypothetical protein